KWAARSRPPATAPAKARPSLSNCRSPPRNRSALIATDMNSRLLIIDDNPSIHADIRKILGKTQLTGPDLEEAEAALFGAAVARSTGADFEIDSAFQGEEGVQKVREAIQQNRPYAMAFVDVRMPPG